ncbi:hypothetical protein Peur_058197 [Populus x canadensis]
MAELCVDWSSRFLPGSLSTLALLGGGCNFQLLWIAKLWGRASVPVFSPSFSSGFGGLFNRSYLLVLSLELSYIFFGLFVAPFPPVSSFHYCPLSLFFVPC